MDRLISEKSVMEVIYGCDWFIDEEHAEVIKERIKSISSAEPKTGHWIKYGIPRCEEQHYQCTSCGYYINFGQWGELYTKEFKYCPNCGCRMVESQESEG